MGRKTPLMPARTHSKLKWKNPVRYCMSFHEVTTASVPSRNVRMSISRLRPSSARLKLMPKLGIQSALNSLIQFDPTDPAFVSALTYNKIERNRFNNTARSEIHRQRALDHCARIHASTPPPIRIMINHSKIIGQFVYINFITLSLDAQ